MTGSLAHSPADIIRNMLVDLGYGTQPTDSGSYPIYSDNEPDTPDNSITVYNTEGVLQGRTHVDGETQVFYGIQVRSRNASVVDGYVKIKSIATALDTEVKRQVVYIGSSNYIVHAVTRTSDIINVRPQSEATRRWIHTVNAIASITQATGTGSGT